MLVVELETKVCKDFTITEKAPTKVNWVNVCFAYCPNSVLNVKVLVGAFNQEKALVRDCEIFRNLWITFV